ncbi:MAG: hypothetical protein ACJ72N_26630 [Labedaea sp.]
MGIRTRLIAFMMAAAALTAVAGAASASAAPASATAPAPSGTKDGKKEGAGGVSFAQVAASLHVSEQRLAAAVDNLKRALGKGTDESVAVAAFAKELGISPEQAKKVMQMLSGDGNKRPKPGNGKEPGVPAEAVELLATELHISAARAGQVFRDLDNVKANGADVVKDPEFIAMAKGLGITPQRLLAALIKVKQELGGKPGSQQDKVPSGTPTK